VVSSTSSERGPAIDPNEQDRALAESASWLWRWLAEQALPLWWRAGADHVGGGFFESLGQDGVALPAPRRCRVQPRQIYAFALSWRVGWDGPAGAVAEHGLGYFIEKYRRPDGLFRTSVEADGRVRDDRAVLYDQAFALLGLFGAHQIEPRPWVRQAAESLLERILQHFKHPAGGFREDDGAPFQSNAQMHLFEACIAWGAVAGGKFTDTANELGSLCLDRLIDCEHGVIDEYYDADWRLDRPNDERRIEPGHQLEWAWLLSEWSKAGERSVDGYVERLFEVGEASVIPSINAAPAAISLDGATSDPVARLWPQTERLRTAAFLSRAARSDRAVYTRAAARAAASVRSYLETPVSGLWRDKQKLDGTFVDEPAPASSLYHLAGAIAALKTLAIDMAAQTKGAG
jgi:mannose/cellobiose epimerase-like protein (N-acyl-D-glucosamine 2-epimerase family)